MSLSATLERLAGVPAPLPVRRTARLMLRPFQEADREPFAAMNADPEVARHLLAPLGRAESDALMDRARVDAARRGFGVFAVQERAGGAFVGMVGLSVPSWEAEFTPCVEIGWRLARGAWGQGFATEAAADVLAWAFTTLRLPQVVSFTAVDNARSWRVMERLGMQRVGTFEHPRVPPGHPLRTHVRYALDAPVAAAPPPVVAPAPSAVPAPPKSPLPALWLDGDGCPRAIKELAWRAAQRGAVEVVLVANRPVHVPRHARIRSVVVPQGLDVADAWLVAHAQPRDLVVTSDVPLAAELVARGVQVLSPRGEVFTPQNIGEKLSLRDFFTEARAAGIVEGGGPAEMDERSKRLFANGLDRWISHRTRELAGSA